MHGRYVARTGNVVESETPDLLAARVLCLDLGNQSVEVPAHRIMHRLNFHARRAQPPCQAPSTGIGSLWFVEGFVADGGSLPRWSMPAVLH